MTRRAFGLTVAGLTLLAAGLSTGVPAYYALAAACGGLLAVGLVSCLLTLGTMRITLQTGRQRVRRGEQATLRLKVFHAGVLPLGSLRLQVRTAAEPLQVDLQCPPLREHQRALNIACPHRGVYQLGVERVSVQDLSGLFSLSRRVRAAGCTVEVSPLVRAAAPMELGAGDTGPEARARSAEDNASPSGIRAWRDGDELKKVHWKLTMRRREVMVRTYEETARPDTLVLLDLSPIQALPGQKLAIEDAACEAALSAVCAQLQAGYPVRMPLSCSRPTEVQGASAADLPGFAEALTTTPFDCAYPYEQLLAVEMRRVQRTGGAVLVTSHMTMRGADIAMQMRAGGLRVRVCWVTESSRREGTEIEARLALAGIEVQRISPLGTKTERA